ncbi:hypothetical protein NCS52_00141700 [Fusarium sp. LHS14.1]|nr:hypothetical protein NCS52_00141700 [Fusarium sp. LHS14.1]
MVHAWLGEETKPSKAKMISTPAVDGWVSFLIASMKCLKQGMNGHKKKMIQPSRAGTEIISFLIGNQPFDDKSPWNLMTTDEIALGLKDILQRPYFSRIWVVQEAALGQAVKMQVGETAFEWGGNEGTRGFLARIKLLEILPAWQKNKKLNSIDMRPLRELLEQTVAHMDKLAGVSPHATFLDIVHQMRHRQSTDPRDKIFGLLGLALPAEIA